MSETEQWVEINRKYAEEWPNIVHKGVSPADSDDWKDKPDKLQYLSPNPGQGN